MNLGAKLRSVLTALTLLCSTGVHGSTDADASTPRPLLPDSGWSHYGAQPGGEKHSALNQIDTSNVQLLEEAWRYRTGDVSDGSGTVLPTAMQVTPILVDGTLYFCTPYNRVIALDAGTGRERWSFDPRMDLTRSNVGIHRCRGVTYWESKKAHAATASCHRKIFLGTGDGRLLAIDAGNGRPCSGFGRNGFVNLNALEKNGSDAIGITSPPVVFGDIVIVGSMIPSYEHADATDGIVWAFDAMTGLERWHWNPVPEDMRHETGGINVWAPMSVDTEQGLVLLPTSSPTPDSFGGSRKRPLEYANAIVALDASTGEPRWHFQTVHHDLWDYDLPAQPTLISVQRQGGSIPAVAQVTKTGFTFILDRRTGEPLFPVEEHPVPRSDVPGESSSPTQPYPRLPPPVTRQQVSSEDAWGLTFWDRGWCRDRMAELRNEGLFTPPSIGGTLQLPSAAGGANWGGAAFDPASRLLVVNVTNVAGFVELIPRARLAPSEIESSIDAGAMLGTPYVMRSGPLLSPWGIPCSPPPWGEIAAIHVDTGQIAWRVPLGQVKVLGPISTPGNWGSPNVGGPITTAGGLVFIAATRDNALRALDIRNGRELWRGRLPAPGMATPMTYAHGPDHRQFVIIAAGGHPYLGGDLGDAVIAFSLPPGNHPPR